MKTCTVKHKQTNKKTLHFCFCSQKIQFLCHTFPIKQGHQSHLAEYGVHTWQHSTVKVEEGQCSKSLSVKNQDANMVQRPASITSWTPLLLPQINSEPTAKAYSDPTCKSKTQAASTQCKYNYATKLQGLEFILTTCKGFFTVFPLLNREIKPPSCVMLK